MHLAPLDRQIDVSAAFVTAYRLEPGAEQIVRERDVLEGIRPLAGSPHDQLDIFSLVHGLGGGRVPHLKDVLYHRERTGAAVIFPVRKYPICIRCPATE